MLVFLFFFHFNARPDLVMPSEDVDPNIPNKLDTTLNTHSNISTSTPTLSSSLCTPHPMTPLTPGMLSTTRLIPQSNVMTKRYYSHNPWAELNYKAEVDVTFSSGESKCDDVMLTLSSGHLARFADGCAVVSLGDTSVMVTAVSRDTKTSPQSFLPLTVDYREKSAAAGRIPTNYLRRELGPSDREILTSRMIDRSVRSQFPINFTNDTQLVCNLLAVDGVNYPDILSINAASAALAISDIPWNGPVGAVRVGLINGDIMINPTRQQQSRSKLNMVVTATEQNKVVMFDCSAENVELPYFKKAVKQGVKATQRIIHGIKELCRKCGKEKRKLENQERLDPEIVTIIKHLSVNRLSVIFTDVSHHKISRDVAVNELREDVMKQLVEQYPTVDFNLLKEEFGSLTKSVFRDLIFEHDQRCDGRQLGDIRHISLHRSIFTHHFMGPLYFNADRLK